MLNKTGRERFGMVIGTGMDVIEVGRVADAAGRGNYMDTFFTQREREHFGGILKDARTIAGSIAAKEAAARALSVGFGGVCFRDIEIFHLPDGGVRAVLSRGALDRLNQLRGRVLNINISHIKELAVAQAILED